MTTVSLAPHLQRALEAMSKDLGVEQQAVVNQAVFAWLRINGYAPKVEQQRHRPPPPQPSPPQPPPPPPLSPSPRGGEGRGEGLPPPAPVPSVDVAPLLQRMAEIDADLEKLTRPWAAWAPVQEEEEEDEEEEEEEEESEDSSPHPEPSPEGRGDEVENPFDDGAGESTIVLRSSPLSLYIERQGYEPVQVNEDRFIIGRGPHCHMVIDSPRVSREHVALTRKGVLFLLEDLNSSNGTWLGEERISLRELESGDVIKLGNEPVTFVIRGE